VALNAKVPATIAEFLVTPTPESWIDAAAGRLADLLLDHANCELKAASTALGFIYRYPERSGLCSRMSRLAREELRHFEQVRRIMEQLSMPFAKRSASRYAGSLRDCVRREEPHRLLDSLLVAALIEARSCERFAALAPQLEEPLRGFYLGLLASEARHFEVYLALAQQQCGIGDQALERRLTDLKRVESDLITSADSEFRFHSGPPA
jgi:tRNA-(ms[2]io[6]A)-hydroxylase